MNLDNDYDNDGNNIVPCPICLNVYCPSKEDDGVCPEEKDFVKAMETKIHPDKKLEEPKETLCLDCGQLRLNYIGATECGNCGSKNIKVGKIGELEK